MNHQHSYKSIYLHSIGIKKILNSKKNPIKLELTLRIGIRNRRNFMHGECVIFKGVTLSREQQKSLAILNDLIENGYTRINNQKGIYTIFIKIRGVNRSSNTRSSLKKFHNSLLE